MKIEFDSAKDKSNAAKHGVSLVFGANIFDDLYFVSFAASRPEDKEDRQKAIGMVDGKLYSAVYVWRGDVIRFISVRKANKNEQRAYHSH